VVTAGYRTESAMLAVSRSSARVHAACPGAFRAVGCGHYCSLGGAGRKKRRKGLAPAGIDRVITGFRAGRSRELGFHVRGVDPVRPEGSDALRATGSTSLLNELSANFRNSTMLRSRVPILSHVFALPGSDLVVAASTSVSPPRGEVFSSARLGR